eukprot:9473591-Pyramimonas_sp.AAC.1
MFLGVPNICQPGAYLGFGNTRHQNAKLLRLRRLMWVTGSSSLTFQPLHDSFEHNPWSCFSHFDSGGAGSKVSVGSRGLRRCGGSRRAGIGRQAERYCI